MTPSTILTAGYGNRGFAGFIDLLKAHGVTHFVDVRSVPQSSYWEDFRRPNLERLVPETGLRYVWMGDTLGGVPSINPLSYANEDSLSQNGRAPIFCKTDPELFDLHPLFHDPKFRMGLRKLIEAASSSNRKICLVCGCLRPHKCHRSRLIGEALIQEGVGVLHLDDKGEPVSQQQVAKESEPSQTALF